MCYMLLFMSAQVEVGLKLFMSAQVEVALIRVGGNALLI